MACPRCGGAAHVLVSPGLAQCTGTVLVNTGAPPSGAFGPPQIPQPCGQRYQVAPNGPSLGICSCGMGAIAVCVTCGAPLCLDHAYRRSGQMHCRDCTTKIDRDREQAAHFAEVEAIARVVEAASKITEAHILAGDHRLLFHLEGSLSPCPVKGDHCPDHGPLCRVQHVYRWSKWWKKRRYSVTYALLGLRVGWTFLVDAYGRFYEVRNLASEGKRSGEYSQRTHICNGNDAVPAAQLLERMRDRLPSKINGSPIDALNEMAEQLEAIVGAPSNQGTASNPIN